MSAFFVLPVLAIVVLTALCLIAGIVLLIWRKTRPLGLYVLMIEPGAVAGLILAGWAWERLDLLVGLAGMQNQPEWAGWGVLGLMAVWFGIGTLGGATAGLALATWIWWHYAPEPYRPLLINWYQKLKAIEFPFRQRWGRSQPASSGGMESSE